MSQGLNETDEGASLLLAVVNNELYAADYEKNNELKQYDKLDNKWITLGKLPVHSKDKYGRDMGFRACGDRLIVIGPPSVWWLSFIHGSRMGNRLCGICLPHGHTGTTKFCVP